VGVECWRTYEDSEDGLWELNGNECEAGRDVGRGSSRLNNPNNEGESDEESTALGIGQKSLNNSKNSTELRLLTCDLGTDLLLNDAV